MATPFVMSLSIGISGWLLDGRSYDLLPNLGISLGLTYAGAFVGGIVIPLIFIAMMIVVSLGMPIVEKANFFDKNSTFAYLVSAHLFSIVGAISGGFLSIFLARKARVPVQSSLINGADQDVSFSIPLPSVDMREMRQDRVKKIETVVSLVLVNYKF